jgi:hypothetical protein
MTVWKRCEDEILNFAWRKMGALPVALNRTMTY